MSEKELIIALQVIPKASKNEVLGWVETATGGKALKVKVTAAPEAGKANKAVLELLAQYWGCAKRDLELVTGATNRNKLLKIMDTNLIHKLP